MVSPLSSAASRPVLPPPPNPEQAFRQIDNTSKGYITESDLASAIVNISPEGKNLSQTEATAKAKDAIQKMDSNQDGKVTQSEFTAAAPKPPAQGGQPSGPPPGGGPGGPPPGGPGGGKPASDSESSTSFDPADTNKDGTVTLVEQQAYTIKHPSSSTSTSGLTASDAVKTYQNMRLAE
jgi:EF-hand domain pair